MKKLVLLLVLPMLPALAMADETKFSNETQLSLLQTGGNSKVETYNLTTKSSVVKGMDNYEIGGHYVLGSSEDAATEDMVESARNWDVYVKYTRDLSKKLGLFLQYQIEGNEFAGFKQRDNIDFGAKYTFIKTDKKNFFAELGLRQTQEKSVARDEDNEDEFTYNKGRLYSEYSHKATETLSYKFWAEYVPNFTESDDYLITFEPSIAVVMSETFSLKVAYKGVYDNEPAVENNERNEYLDYTTTTSLIAKF